MLQIFSVTTAYFWSIFSQISVHFQSIFFHLQQVMSTSSSFTERFQSIFNPYRWLPILKLFLSKSYP